MTRASNGNGSGEPPAAELVVVHVTDAISTALAGHDGVEYQSPPLARAEALDLVRVLIGDDPRCSTPLSPAGAARSPAASARSRSRARPTAAEPARGG